MTIMPILPAYRHPDGRHLLVWCQHCGRYHRHRLPFTAAPRIAHCPTNGDSPYCRTGYKLEDAGPAPPEVVRAADRQEIRPEGRIW